MRAHVNALILASFAEALESGLVPLEAQLSEQAVEALLSAQSPNYNLAAEIFRLKFTAFERLSGPSKATVALRSKCGEMLEAAGAGDDAIDEYRALATECRAVLHALQPVDGGAVTTWMNAGVACRRRGRARDAERCYDEAVRLLGRGEPGKVRSTLHLNRIILYHRSSLPGRETKASAAACDLLGMPPRRSAEVLATFLDNGNGSVTIAMADGAEWTYASGDDGPRRAAGSVARALDQPMVDLRACAGEEAGQVSSEALQQAQRQRARASIMNPCDGCGAVRPVEQQKRCGGCRLVSYCSVDCQRAAWKAHKPVCREAAARGSAVGGAAGGAAGGGVGCG
jgi:hypothetical protein